MGFLSVWIALQLSAYATDMSTIEPELELITSHCEGELRKHTDWVPDDELQPVALSVLREEELVVTIHAKSFDTNNFENWISRPGFYNPEYYIGSCFFLPQEEENIYQIELMSHKDKLLVTAQDVDEVFELTLSLPEQCANDDVPGYLFAQFRRNGRWEMASTQTCLPPPPALD